MVDGVCACEARCAPKPEQKPVAPRLTANCRWTAQNLPAPLHSPIPSPPSTSPPLKPPHASLKTTACLTFIAATPSLSFGLSSPPLLLLLQQHARMNTALKGGAGVAVQPITTATTTTTSGWQQHGLSRTAAFQHPAISGSVCCRPQLPAGTTVSALLCTTCMQQRPSLSQ